MLPSMGNLKACSHFQGWEFQRWKCVFVTEKHIDPKGQYNWLPLSQATAKPSTLFKCMLVRGGASFLKLWHCPTKAWGTRRSLTSQGHRRASNLNCMRGEDEIGYVQISYRARLDLCPFPIFWSLNAFEHLWKLEPLSSFLAKSQPSSYYWEGPEWKRNITTGSNSRVSTPDI